MAAQILTRFLVLSDTHGLELNENSLPFLQHNLRADVVLHCGDLSETGTSEEYCNTISLLENIVAELKLVIAWNHDLTLDPDRCSAQDHKTAIDLWQSAKMKDIFYLREGIHSFKLKSGADFTVYASPYQPRTALSNWAFQYPTNHDRFNPTSDELSENIASNPVPSYPQVDIMMMHGPPAGRLDRTGRGDQVGCQYLLQALSRARPRLHCFGHVHSAFGAHTIKWGDKDTIEFELAEWVSETQKRKQGHIHRDLEKKGITPGQATFLVNAAILDDDSQPSNVPWLIEMDLSRP